MAAEHVACCRNRNAPRVKTSLEPPYFQSWRLNSEAPSMLSPGVGSRHTGCAPRVNAVRNFVPDIIPRVSDRLIPHIEGKYSAQMRVYEIVNISLCSTSSSSYLVLSSQVWYSFLHRFLCLPVPFSLYSVHSVLFNSKFLLISIPSRSVHLRRS
jgi:hypothetical protein